jgi:hypothetical protein
VQRFFGELVRLVQVETGLIKKQFLWIAAHGIPPMADHFG